MRLVRVADQDAASWAEAIRDAAALLRAGKLVAFPTETVYGLGANALDAAAVRRVYEAKGRPGINPIIVHVASTLEARALSTEWTPAAAALADAFWPGPITLVVRRKDVIPAIVTAGGDTVGLRVPAHPIALALLKEARLPIAAPSANLATQVSPTTAQHVATGLGDRVDLVLDGGPTTVGIESTVVDVSGAVPRILRPGMIGGEDIARVAGETIHSLSRGGEQAPRSPGVVGKHYAPRAAVTLWPSSEREQAIARARAAVATGTRVGVIAFRPLGVAATSGHTMPADPAGYARQLYAALHAVDAAGCDVVMIERPPDTPEWGGVIDRLERAAK